MVGHRPHRIHAFCNTMASIKIPSIANSGYGQFAPYREKVCGKHRPFRTVLPAFFHFSLDSRSCPWYGNCTNTHNTVNTQWQEGVSADDLPGLSGQPPPVPAGEGQSAADDADGAAAAGRKAAVGAESGHTAGHQPQHHPAGIQRTGGGGVHLLRVRQGQLCRRRGRRAAAAYP